MKDAQDVHESEIKQISLTEFRELGLIQEINRLLLHPMGMALSVVVEADGTVSSFGPVWDYREDPEGLMYHEDHPPDAEKAETVNRLFEAKRAERERTLGFFIQPAEQIAGGK